MSKARTQSVAFCLVTGLVTLAGVRCAGSGDVTTSEAVAGSQGAGAGTSTGTGTGTGTSMSTGTSMASGAGGGSGTSTSGSASGSTSGASSGGGGSSAGGVVRLLAIGDIGEGSPGQHAVADQMSAKCMKVGGCNAVLVNGDNFYDNGVSGTDDPQWVDKFEKPYDRAGLNGLPFYAVLGNHDYGPTSTGNKDAQIDYTALPVGAGPGTRLSDKWHMPEAYYDVKIGDVHIFALDTIDFTSAAQENDMSGRVAMSSATWKLVFGHHPRYTSGEHYWDNQALGFLGLFDFQQAVFCGADIFMAGHDHNVELINKGRDSKCPDTWFVISGAAAKTREKFEFTPNDSEQVFYNEKIEAFAYLEFSGNTLLLEFIDKNGAVMFSKTITK